MSIEPGPRMVSFASMSENKRPQILLTNDDGIESPGLWAAAEALADLGFVSVVAPREQSSGSGRSMPQSSDGVIREEQVCVGGKTWKVYAVGGSPAQAVLHAILEVLPRKPDLVVAGINYGENVGLGVTVSGTVGGAMEGASFGVPSLAISIEAEPKYHLSYSKEIDFSGAAHFTRYFGGMLMAAEPMHDVALLKIEVPADATPDTPWQPTRLSKAKYFIPQRPQRESWNEPAKVSYAVNLDPDKLDPESDVYVLRVARQVSVTPLSLDLSSRIDVAEFGRRFREYARTPEAKVD